jgi:hypothetical protein
MEVTSIFIRRFAGNILLSNEEFARIMQSVNTRSTHMRSAHKFIIQWLFCSRYTKYEQQHVRLAVAVKYSKSNLYFTARSLRLKSTGEI